jgi:hypothetical protein
VLTQLAQRKESPEDQPLNDLDVHGKLIASQALLRAYRAGTLGRYTWDLVGADLDDHLARSRELRDCTTTDSISLYPEGTTAPTREEARKVRKAARSKRKE